ncbi:hypothetical protein AnigIFM56816_010947 [Aspergillus niger]|nr:hypothetical protein AnigIFM56816_010947 [Aspergillus niger]
MNSIPWIGKLVGCFLAELLIERTRCRKTIIVTSVFQVIDLIIEMTAKSWQQFTVGRSFEYLAVGLVENLVPTYCAEIAPSAVRGLLAGSITFVVALGNLWGSGVSRAYVGKMPARGWLIPCAMQLIPAVNILSLVASIPGSPRWLKDEVDNGYVAAEFEAIAEAIQAGYA